MTTYNTISEAFKNGSGDVFFTKDQKFVATSRHDNNYQEMAAKGFTWLKHAEVLSIAESQKPIEAPKKIAAPIAPSAPKKFVNYPDMEVQSFYDEFPDAYGQNL